MNNLSIEIKSEELTRAILALAEALKASGTEVLLQPIQQPVQQPVQQPTLMPTQEISYSAEQLAIAATQLVDAGKRNELVQLLQSFGVAALTQMPKERYGEFATKLRAMGAKL